MPRHTFTYTVLCIHVHLDQDTQTNVARLIEVILTYFYKSFHSARHGELFAVCWAGLLGDGVLGKAPAFLHHQLLGGAFVRVEIFVLTNAYVCTGTRQHTEIESSMYN
jgi:hypothetical protein